MSAHMEIVQAPSGLHAKPGPANGGPFRMSLTKEDMPCEHMILLPSIARPSALTGCFRSSIRLPDTTVHDTTVHDTTVHLATRPTISSAPATMSIASR